MSFALNFVLEVYPVEAIYLEDLAPKLHELVPNLRDRRQTMKQETNRLKKMYENKEQSDNQYKKHYYRS